LVKRRLKSFSGNFVQCNTITYKASKSLDKILRQKALFIFIGLTQCVYPILLLLTDTMEFHEKLPNLNERRANLREKCDLFDGCAHVESLNHWPFPEKFFPFNLDNAKSKSNP
jgi:hypothetical protein